MQIDFCVRAPSLGLRTVVESFASTDTTIDGALRPAFERFARGSFHVLLASLVREDLGSDQVEWETWGHGTNTWRVCVGALLQLYHPVAGLQFADWVDGVRDAVEKASLSREPHWIRAYCARRGDEELGHEVLLDNEPWPDAEPLLTARAWPSSEQAYGIRHFIMLSPG